MSAQHMPGPWSLERTTAPRGWIVSAKDGQYDIAILRDASAPTKTEANANLIAAAPDLLNALQALLDMDIAYQRGWKVEDAVDAARAVVARATGGDS